VIQLDQLQLLHRHGNEWLPLDAVANPREHLDPVDHDVEQQILRGARLYKCDSCELEIMAVPPGTRG
jgi:hypothetical protein